MRSRGHSGELVKQHERLLLPGWTSILNKIQRSSDGLTLEVEERGNINARMSGSHKENTENQY
jgi:hypothetical protein